MSCIRNETDVVKSLMNSLVDTSNAILIKIFPIMQKLVNPDNEFVDEIIYSTQIQDNIKVNEWLQNQTILLIFNSEHIRKEANIFINSYEKGSDDLLYKNSKQYPFLSEVWFGDNYDGKEGTEALQNLMVDLKKDLDSANDYNLIERAVLHFSQPQPQ